MTTTMTTGGPTRTRVRWRRVLLIALAIAVLAEVGVRALDSRLPPVTGWPGYEYAVHEEQLAALGGDPDLLVIGDSSAAVAIRPDELVEDGVASSGYNYWLGGAPMRSLELHASEVLLPRTTPRTVVVAVTMRNFNEAPSQEGHLAALRASSAFRRVTGRRSWLDHVDDRLQAGSAVFRHREILRDPLDWSGPCGPRASPTDSRATATSPTEVAIAWPTKRQGIAERSGRRWRTSPCRLERSVRSTTC
jgi:hypothetical protein